MSAKPSSTFTLASLFYGQRVAFLTTMTRCMGRILSEESDQRRMIIVEAHVTNPDPKLQGRYGFRLLDPDRIARNKIETDEEFNERLEVIHEEHESRSQLHVEFLEEGMLASHRAEDSFRQARADLDRRATFGYLDLYARFCAEREHISLIHEKQRVATMRISQQRRRLEFEEEDNRRTIMRDEDVKSRKFLREGLLEGRDLWPTQRAYEAYLRQQELDREARRRTDLALARRQAQERDDAEKREEMEAEEETERKKVIRHEQSARADLFRLAKQTLNRLTPSSLV